MLPSIQPLFTRLAGYIDRLKQTVGLNASRIGGRPATIAIPLYTTIHRRLSRFTARLRDLLARIEAEQSGQRRPYIPRPTKTRPSNTSTPAPTTDHRPPTTAFGWLSRLSGDVREQASGFATILCNPEMESLIARDPRVGRILRPICHMLGLKLATIYLRVSPANQPKPTTPHDDPTTIHPFYLRRHPLVRDPSPRRPRKPRMKRPAKPILPPARNHVPGQAYYYTHDDFKHVLGPIRRKKPRDPAAKFCAARAK